MNKLKTTPANKYNNDYTNDQLKDTLLSFGILIFGFIALFILICQLTQF